MRLVPRATVTEVYAWTTTRLSHCQEQRDHGSRDPRDYRVVHLLAGPVIDTTVLFGTPCAVPAANPALLGLAFRPTDRRRPPLSVAALDVYSLYQHGLSYRWAIPRTLDLAHPASATSTSFSHLLTASDSTISAVRLSICKASHHNAMHGRQLAHALYLTVQDAHPLGNNRCMKVGPTHTHCDICFAIDGVLRRETARHVTHECPYSQIVIDPLLRSFASRYVADRAALATLPTAQLLSLFERLYTTGSTIDTTIPAVVAANFAGSICLALFQRASRNAPGCP